MSTGSTHVRASLIVASGFGLGAIVSFNPTLLECSVGALLGIIISPDLDVDKAFIGDKYVEQRTGWIGKKIWLWFWTTLDTSGSSSEKMDGSEACFIPVSPFLQQT